MIASQLDDTTSAWAATWIVKNEWPQAQHSAYDSLLSILHFILSLKNEIPSRRAQQRQAGSTGASLSAFFVKRGQFRAWPSWALIGRLPFLHPCPCLAPFPSSHPRPARSSLVSPFQHSRTPTKLHHRPPIITSRLPYWLRSSGTHYY